MESRTTFGSFLPDSSYTKPTIASSSPTIEIGSNEDDPLVQIILSTAWFLIFLCVVVVNSLALVVFYRTRHSHASTKIFLMSLTMADLCIGLVYAAPTGLAPWFDRELLFSGVFCSFQAYIGTLFAYGGLLSLFGVNAERFIAVVYPLRYPTIMTVKRSKYIVSAIWILVAVYVTLQGFVSKWNSIFVVYFLQCFPTGHTDSSAILFWSVVAITIPGAYIATVCMYGKVYVVARGHTKRLEQYRRRRSSSSGVSSANSDTKTATTVFIVLAMYGVAWLPAFALMTFLIITGDVAPVYITHVVRMVTISNSWIDAVIYAVRTEQFQRECKAILRLK